MGALVWILILSAAGGLAITWYRNKKKYSDPVYVRNLARAAECLAIVEAFDGYITWVRRDRILSDYGDAVRYFQGKNRYYEKEPRVESFNEIFGDFKQYVVAYNKKFVRREKERLRIFFDSIEGKSLDDQQRNAVVTDEYSNLIIAGAGSGKTLTILAKLKYLVEHRIIAPDEILLLSLTKKTVEELNERLAAIGLDTRATTFHKLGYDTIKQFENEIPVVTNDNTLSQVIDAYLRKDIFDDPAALDAYIQYVACYMNIPEVIDQYGSLGEKIDTEKGIDFQTLKAKCELNRQAVAALDTLQGEKVKSVEELTIANFLYLNGIRYEYERRYPFGTVVYRPDFYLTDYDIWLEHFGIDENQRAQWLTPLNEQKYLEDMTLKRNAHAEHNTKLLETYSYYNKHKVLLTRLEEMLVAEGVEFAPLDPKNIYEKITENDQRFGRELTKLIESFINLSKSRRLGHDALNALFSDKSAVQNAYMFERQQLFVRFVLPILVKYDAVLQDRAEIDFNDMINRATDAIKRQNRYDALQYIIIDEYQDISFSRFNLIREIRERTGARLICVGDDWQSIYRFAGSDISLFRNFETHLGQSERLLIEQTFRNSQALIHISAQFIQKNGHQIPKNPKSKKLPVRDPIQFVSYREDTLVEVFLNELQRLHDQYGNASVLVLGRHGFDLDELIKSSASDKIRHIERTGQLIVKGFESVDMRFLTVHKSKGLEADNVIVLKVKNHLLGFPNKMTDDPVLSVLLNDNEDFPFAEERRLFYVALTRTRNEVILLTPPDHSLFVEELLADHHYLLTSDHGTINATHCPYCQTGKLVIRQNTARATQFLGCSHYPICDQTFNSIAILENSILCPGCESGFMVKRTGVYGEFLGCTAYPKCRQTIQL